MVGVCCAGRSTEPPPGRDFRYLNGSDEKAVLACSKKSATRTWVFIMNRDYPKAKAQERFGPPLKWILPGCPA